MNLAGSNRRKRSVAYPCRRQSFLGKPSLQVARALIRRGCVWHTFITIARVRDAVSGWTDLGNRARVIDTLTRNSIEPAWLSETGLCCKADDSVTQDRTGCACLARKVFVEFLVTFIDIFYQSS